MESHDSEFAATMNDGHGKNGAKPSPAKPERPKGMDAVRQTERSSILHIVAMALSEAESATRAINPHYGESSMSDEVFHAGLDEAMTCISAAVFHLMNLHDTTFGKAQGGVFDLSSLEMQFPDGPTF